MLDFKFVHLPLCTIFLQIPHLTIILHTEPRMLDFSQTSQLKWNATRSHM